MSASANIVLAACGRFHMPALATQFARMGRLRMMYALSVRPFPPVDVSWGQYHNHWWSAMNRRASQRFGLRYSMATEADSFAADIAESLASQGPGILHGWNGVMHPAFKRLEGRGWLSCVERSCPHNQVQYDLLKEEGERLGVPHVEDMDALKRSIEELYLADVIAAPSSYSAASYADPVLKAKVRVNTLGSNFVFKPRSGRRSEHLRILMVGNDFLRKGSHYLIEAFKLIDDGKAELWIRGQIPSAYAKRLVHPRIRVFGELLPGALNELYASASIFVQPSIDEGFGMTVLEALAHGLPLVVTENVGAKDILTRDVAITVPIRDPAALAKAILAARDLPGEAFDTARRHIVEKNTWTACARRMLQEVYVPGANASSAIFRGSESLPNRAG